MPHFNGAVLYRVEHLQTRHDFTGCEKLDLEFVVGGLCDSLAHDVDAAVNCVQRLRPARGASPFQPRHGLRNCRRGNRHRTCGPESRDLDKIPTFHDLLPFDLSSLSSARLPTDVEEREWNVPLLISIPGRPK